MRRLLFTLLALLAAVRARYSTVPIPHTETKRTTGHELADLFQAHASNTTLDKVSTNTDYYCIIGFDHEEILAVYFHANELNPQTVFSWNAGLCSTSCDPKDWSASVAFITLKDDTSKSAIKSKRSPQDPVKRGNVDTACITGFSIDEIMEGVNYINGITGAGARSEADDCLSYLDRIAEYDEFVVCGDGKC